MNVEVVTFDDVVDVRVDGDLVASVDVHGDETVARLFDADDPTDAVAEIRN